MHSNWHIKSSQRPQKQNFYYYTGLAFFPHRYFYLTQNFICVSYRRLVQFVKLVFNIVWKITNLKSISVKTFHLFECTEHLLCKYLCLCVWNLQYRGFSCDIIIMKPILQVITLTTAMLVSTSHILVWETQQMSKNFVLRLNHKTKLQTKWHYSYSQSQLLTFLCSISNGIYFGWGFLLGLIFFW